MIFGQSQNIRHTSIRNDQRSVDITYVQQGTRQLTSIACSICYLAHGRETPLKVHPQKRFPSAPHPPSPVENIPRISGKLGDTGV